LWDLDILSISDPSERQTKKELSEAAEEHFLASLRREHDGRYEISLPWLSDHQSLPTNRLIAEKRLKSTVKRLKDSALLSEYEDVFKAWLNENIIEEVSDSDSLNCHYLPHRAVIRENSTTRIRPVFDASAKEKGTVSLNDCLEAGPNYLEMIPTVLNRFRLGAIGVTADIRKAFLQISVNPRDRDFLRFLWYENGNPEKLKIYRHRRVVFGVNASPFLLAATLKHHLTQVPSDLQETAKKLEYSMYVDNCVASVNSISELDTFILQSKQIMSDARFDLRGWRYNSKSLSLPHEELESPSQNFQSMEEKEDCVAVLGLNWNIREDIISCCVKEDCNPECQTLSKRSILSQANKIFDPLGFISPVTLVPKILMQECWRRKLSWDTELPSDLANKFRKWKTGLTSLNNLKIPRRILPNNDIDFETKLSFHVFCDASKFAYATCIYLRSEVGKEVHCQLVQSRTRVAPLKPITIPRLELLSCLIGTRLMNSIKSDLELRNVPVYYWSDSMDALFWIKNEEVWATFVKNRVNEIRTFSQPHEWNHVPGRLNPADYPSRGSSVNTLIKLKWWEGPEWLKGPIEQWPKSDVFPNLEVVNSEKRKTIISAVSTLNENVNFFDRFSSYRTILKVVAWIYRFYSNSKKLKKNRVVGALSANEIKGAELIVVKLIQRECFSELKGKDLVRLRPFIDSNGIFRIKSRVLNRNDTDDFRYPVVLPSDHPLVDKLIRSRHEASGHAGVQYMMSSLREEFWIIRARKTIRRIVRKCTKCSRFDSKPIEIPLSPLPEDRVRNANVFEIVGVDLAGPLILKGNSKTWIVIFTCAVFRAVHLELVSALSTESFLQAFRRFVARRGRPSIVYSDNGTNFTGASNLFKTIEWNSVHDQASIEKITWKFIPPSAPWWGGWWERLIGMMKSIIRRVLGRASLSYEELFTILCDCESVLNNRPLTYLSNDPGDLVPLTPSMFLQEVKESGVPDLDQLDAQKLKKRYAYRQKIRDDFRKRFRSEYLGQLRQSSKLVKEKSAVKVGDVVLISNDNAKRIEWPLGKIIEVFKSKDGYVRLAKIKTDRGELFRPVQRLYPLEVTENVGEPIRQRIAEATKEPSDSHLRTRRGRVVREPARYTP
jgi:hypothetical protein